MPAKKSAGDRARARERAKIEAEQITGVTGLSQRVVAAVLRARDAGDDPMSALPAGQRPNGAQASRSASSVPAHHADHLIPPIRELDADQQPMTVEGFEALPLGVLLGGVHDFKILRGTTASLNLTTSYEFRRLLADAAVISRGNLLVCALYQIPRRAAFASLDGNDPEQPDEGSDHDSDDDDTGAV